MKSTPKGVHFVEVQLKKKAECVPQIVVKKASDIYQLFENLQRSNREKMLAIHLSKKSEIIAVDLVAVGNDTTIVVTNPIIFRAIVLTGCVGFILVHNHPSGDPAPSKADIKFTKRVKKAANHVGIPLLDHIIIGDGCYISLAEQGII